MGAGCSRSESRPHHRAELNGRRRPRAKRSLSSIFICGASSSRSSREIEDDPDELLVNSGECSHREKFELQKKDSALSTNTLARSRSTNAVSTTSHIFSSVNPCREGYSNYVEAGNRGKYLSESKELVPSHRSTSYSRNQGTTSTSDVDKPSPDSVSANRNADVDVVNGASSNGNGDLSQICSGLTDCSSSSSQFLEDSSSDEVSVENHVHEALGFSSPDSDSSSASIVLGSPLNFYSPRDDAIQEANPSGLGFLVSEREQENQDGNLLHVDLVSVSSNIMPSSSSELSNREPRGNSRRLFWDSFSRRGSRRHTDSRTLIFTSDGSDNFGGQDRWLLDFGGDLHNDRARGDSRLYDHGTPSTSEHRPQSRSEIWGRLRGGLDASDRQSGICPRGIHANNTCSCESISMTEESGARAGISRIVMLAEALFEVLDEIHRQPMSLSLSMASLPAPESVVDSFAVRSHRKPENSDRGDDVSQCYICLAEYEEGDQIRVLPCHHEYHMSCIDKWLKEIHGICPLCRRDVREGFTEDTASNSEISSL